MTYRRFRDWADDRGLSHEESNEVIQAAARRGRDVSSLDEDELDDIAREVGIVIGFVQKVWGFISGLFG